MSHEQFNNMQGIIDRASFDQIAQNAKQRRALFMKGNPKIVVMVIGSISLLWVVGLLLEPTFSLRLAEKPIAKIEPRSETSVSTATAEIEKLAALLDRVDAIRPNMAHEIAQLIHQPIYDCNQVPCSSTLQRRNHMARSKLEALLAQKALPDEAEQHPTSREK